jgi:hypothetical protein
MPVPKSLREAIRYRALCPLQYAAGSLRSTFTGRRTTTRRILIASDNLVVTSEEQFAPLLAGRNRTFDEIGVLFDHRLLDEALASPPNPKSYTAVLAKLSFLTPKAEALDKIARLRRLFPHPVRLIYFDGDDDSCIQWPELLDNVDIYVKKHMFSDPTWYQQQFAGKSNLTDYVSRLHGYSFADNAIPHSGVVPAEQMDKVVLGYNIGLDTKITNLFRTTKPSSEAEKTVDVMCRAPCKPEAWIYPFRVPVNDALKPLADQGYKVNVPNERAGQHGYYQEMRSARICVSPFGYGELCWRDFEAVLMGCLLVKPDMGHVRTDPNIFVPGETYVPVRWDFSDLPEVCARYLADDVARKAITARAYQVLADYYRSHNALQRFDEILTLAGAPSAASAAAAMQQRAKHNV